jgi:hypothetical protein
MQVHNTEWITEGALKFIDESTDKPFFLYMPLTRISHKTSTAEA